MREVVLALALVMAMTVAERAAAQSGAPPTQLVTSMGVDRALMSQRVHGYFRGELDLASVAMGLGAGSGYTGGFLLAKATDASRAAAVPILVVGVAQIAIGLGLLVRTGSQVRALDAQIESSPGAYAEAEGARMESVVSRFAIFRAIEAVLLVGGAGTAALGAVLEEDLAIGAGLGLGVQAGVVLVLDAFAEARAERYLEHIRQFRVAPTIVPTDVGNAYGMSVGSQF